AAWGSSPAPRPPGPTPFPPPPRPSPPGPPAPSPTEAPPPFPAAALASPPSSPPSAAGPWALVSAALETSTGFSPPGGLVLSDSTKSSTCGEVPASLATGASAAGFASNRARPLADLDGGAFDAGAAGDRRRGEDSPFGPGSGPGSPAPSPPERASTQTSSASTAVRVRRGSSRMAQARMAPCSTRL